MVSQLPIYKNAIKLLNMFERIHISEIHAHTIFATAVMLGPCPSPVVAILYRQCWKTLYKTVTITKVLFKSKMTRQLQKIYEPVEHLTYPLSVSSATEDLMVKLPLHAELICIIVSLKPKSHMKQQL